MGNAVSLQYIEPFRLCPKDELLEDGGFDAGGGTFEVADNHLRSTEYGIDPLRKEVVGSVTFYHPPDAAVKQDVTREHNSYGLCPHE